MVSVQIIHKGIKIVGIPVGGARKQIADFNMTGKCRYADLRFGRKTRFRHLNGCVVIYADVKVRIVSGCVFISGNDRAARKMDPAGEIFDDDRAVSRAGVFGDRAAGDIQFRIISEINRRAAGRRVSGNQRTFCDRNCAGGVNRAALSADTGIPQDDKITQIQFAAALNQAAIRIDRRVCAVKDDILQVQRACVFKQASGGFTARDQSGERIVGAVGREVERFVRIGRCRCERNGFAVLHTEGIRLRHHIIFQHLNDRSPAEHIAVIADVRQRALQ